MRSQCAVFIDAGYLLAAAATRVTGTSLRSGIEVDHQALVTALMRRAEDDSGLPLLRANWYDSGSRPNGLPDWTQEQIGLMPRVKLRLGRRSLSGEQKGVDLRIGLDLIGHGRERVADVIYLVSGDDDLTEAVEEAQSHGIQVNLLVVPGQSGRPQAVAKHLQRAADDVLLIAAEDIDLTVKNRSIPEELLPRAEDDEDLAAEGGPDAAASTAAADVPELEERRAEANIGGLREAGAGRRRGPAAYHEASPATAKRDIATNGTSAAAGEPAADGADADKTATDADATKAAVTDESAAGNVVGGSDADSDGAAASSTAAGDRAPKAASITPSVLAGKKPTAVIAPKSGPSVAWSSTGGGSMQDWSSTEISVEDIDTVARKVVEGWCRTATPTLLTKLRARRPDIPGDLDRALLMDLSTRSDVYDIPEGARYVLRDRFWQLVDKIKLG